jgi:hypothetical protein
MQAAMTGHERAGVAPMPWRKDDRRARPDRGASGLPRPGLRGTTAARPGGRGGVGSGCDYDAGSSFARQMPAFASCANVGCGLFGTRDR